MKEKQGKFSFMSQEYSTVMCKDVVEVDLDRRKSLFGQVDLWVQQCRLYKGRNYEAIRTTWLHEVLHLVEDFIRSETFTPTDNDIDQIAHLLYDTLSRNKLIVDDWSHVIPTDGGKDGNTNTGRGRRRLQSGVLPEKEGAQPDDSGEEE